MNFLVAPVKFTNSFNIIFNLLSLERRVQVNLALYSAFFKCIIIKHAFDVLDPGFKSLFRA